MNEPAEKLRLRFSKTGRAIYISHLDLMRTMQRSFLRAGLQLKHSEGFNPHAQLTFALPMSVGVTSHCEMMDFKLASYMNIPEICFQLNHALPEGLRALEVYEWDNKFKNIKWLDIDGRFEYDTGAPADRIPGLMDFFQQESIIITRRTKTGTGQSDIAPAIRSILFDEGEGCVCIRAIVSAQEPTLNPEHMISSLAQLAPELSPDFAEFTRSQVYDSDMNIFR